MFNMALSFGDIDLSEINYFCSPFSTDKFDINILKRCIQLKGEIE
jgi:hypothetical protein